MQCGVHTLSDLRPQLPFFQHGHHTSGNLRPFRPPAKPLVCTHVWVTLLCCPVLCTRRHYGSATTAVLLLFDAVTNNYSDIGSIEESRIVNNAASALFTDIAPKLGTTWHNPKTRLGAEMLYCWCIDRPDTHRHYTRKQCTYSSSTCAHEHVALAGVLHDSSRSASGK